MSEPLRFVWSIFFKIVLKNSFLKHNIQFWNSLKIDLILILCFLSAFLGIRKLGSNRICFTFLENGPHPFIAYLGI